MDTHEPVCVIQKQLSCVWACSLAHSGYIYRVRLLTPSVMNVTDTGMWCPIPFSTGRFSLYLALLQLKTVTSDKIKSSFQGSLFHPRTDWHKYAKLISLSKFGAILTNYGVLKLLKGLLMEAQCNHFLTQSCFVPVPSTDASFGEYPHTHLCH